jgi:hypothetical protein
VDAHDSGVIESSEVLRLPLEPQGEVRIPGEVLRDALDCHPTLENGVMGLPDLSHTADTELAHEDVVAKLLAGLEHHGSVLPRARRPRCHPPRGSV